MQNQRLLKVSKDRSYLLDRLSKYEAAESSTESEQESSEEETAGGGKKRKLEMPKKKKMMIKKQPNINQIETDVALVEKHLEARNSISMPMANSFTLQEIFEEVEDI